MIEWFLTSVLTAMSKIPGKNLLEGKLLVLMIDFTARESKTKMSWTTAVRESRKKKTSTTDAPVLVDLNLLAVPPLTVEMRDMM
jgi:hypothetical protein